MRNRGRAALQRRVSGLESIAGFSPCVVFVAAKEFFTSLLEPTLSAASYPPLHKTQGQGTPYIGDVGAIKSPGHPPEFLPWSWR